MSHSLTGDPLTGDQQQRRRSAPAGQWWVVLGLLSAGLLLTGAGCQTLSGRPAVPESVATCQQFSQLGLSAMEHGEWDRAESLLVRAVQACPTNAQARSYYAEALWHRGASAEAISELESAIDLDADDAQAAVRSGEMLLAVGELGRARARAEEALDLNPKLSAAWALRGRVMRALGETDQALADLHRALDYSPNDRQTLLDVAEHYRQQDRPERALVVLHHLVDVYPPGEEPADVLFFLGLAYKALGRHQNAVDCLFAARQRTSGPSADLLFHLGEAELLAGRTGAAEVAVREALATDSRHSPSLDLLGRLQRSEQPRTAAGGAIRR